MRRLQDGTWLAPDDTFNTNTLEGKPFTRKHGYPSKGHPNEFEFRLRFKLPLASKLLEMDKMAFNYYYSQVKSDYLKNNVCSSEVTGANGMFFKNWIVSDIKF